MESIVMRNSMDWLGHCLAASLAAYLAALLALIVWGIASCWLEMAKGQLIENKARRLLEKNLGESQQRGTPVVDPSVQHLRAFQGESRRACATDPPPASWWANQGQVR